MSPDQQYNIFEKINLGVSVYEVKNDGQDIIIKDFNQTASTITKITSTDVIGKNIMEVFPGVKAMGLTDALFDVWKTGISKEVSTKEYKDGRLNTFFENYIYKTSSGYVVAIFRDTTKIKILEEELIIKNEETEKLNKLMMGRELVMAELKKKVVELENEVSKLGGVKI